MKRTLILTSLALALAAGGAEAGCTLDKFAELPVTMSGTQPLVEAKINGADAFFIADSGAAISEISPAKAAQFKLVTRPLPSNIAMGGVGGLEFVSITKIAKFEIGGASFSGLMFLVGGNDYGSDATGLLGQNFLRLADQEYDLAHGAIRLWRAQGCATGVLAYWAPQGPYSVVDMAPTNANSPQAEADAYVNGVRIRVGLDSGSSTSVLSLGAAKRAGIDLNGAGVVSAGSAYGIGRHETASWIAPVDSFKFGDEQILHTRLRISDINGLGLDMLLGADFLLSHRVMVAQSQSKIYFTYNGGPVFNLTGTARAAATPAAPPTDEATPTDAAGFARRGAAFAARRDFEAAVADYTRAIELAPIMADYPLQRALAHLGARQPVLAMADLDLALKLQPDNARALMLRANLRLRSDDARDAVADLDAADRALPKESSERMSLPLLYERAGDPAKALAQYDIWIKAHPDDVHLTEALNGRCWERALVGTELDKAMDDCQASLRRSPGAWNTVDSRGLVHLRQGAIDAAIADYDQVLKQQPKSPWSLYGRGLAKLKKGLTADGKADIAAATALDPKLPQTAAKYGIGP